MLLYSIHYVRLVPTTQTPAKLSATAAQLALFVPKKECKYHAYALQASSAK